MPDDPEFDPAWLNSLGERFERLMQELKTIERERDEFLIKYGNPKEENKEEGDDECAAAKYSIIRSAASINLALYFILWTATRT